MQSDLRLTYTFPAERRLLRASEFKAVFDHAVYKVHQSGFMLLAIPLETAPRLGLVIAKRKIRRAHERNRVKRLARESFRLHQHRLPPLDIVLMAKADAQVLSNEELHQQLQVAWQQLGKRFARQASGTPPTAKQVAGKTQDLSTNAVNKSTGAAS